MTIEPWARRDFVRVFHPTADQERQNTPVSGFRRESRFGVYAAVLMAGFMGGASLVLFVQGLGA